MPASLVLLTGRSFSGKSSVASVIAASLEAVVLSYDAINDERGLRGGTGVSTEEWARTNDLAQERARGLLQEGRSVVVDDTSSPRFLRDAWRALAAEQQVDFLLVFVDTDVRTIRRRLVENRVTGQRHDVTDAVMDEHLRAFEPPTADEPHIVVTERDGSDDVTTKVALARTRSPAG